MPCSFVVCLLIGGGTYLRMVSFSFTSQVGDGSSRFPLAWMEMHVDGGLLEVEDEEDDELLDTDRLDGGNVAAIM